MGFSQSRTQSAFHYGARAKDCNRDPSPRSESRGPGTNQLHLQTSHLCQRAEFEPRHVGYLIKIWAHCPPNNNEQACDVTLFHKPMTVFAIGGLLLYSDALDGFTLVE